ncbi:MAG TPA: tyrosine-type recombinase/integrase, partial [Micropepsaceae bacterium]|nr:tyrosine-type recombinase/integrase [Micropepsaceae bacterium]
MRLWRHRNGFYYVLHGPRLKKHYSLRTRDRGQAEARFADMLASGAAVPTDPTVTQILKAYEADRLPMVRGKDTLRFGVITLIRHFDNLPPKHLTPRAIKRYAQDRGVKPGTVLREIGILRAAMSWAAENKWIDARDKPIISNPVKAPAPRARWVTKDEARRLLAECVEPHLKLFVMLGLMTVARMGAILEAKWQQVNWDQRLIDYGEGHGNKHRAVVPLNDEMFAMLEAAKELACSEYIVGYRGGRVLSIKKGFAA